jgi:cell division transport system permease protein
MLKYREWLSLHKDAMHRTIVGILRAPFVTLLQIFSLSFMLFVPLMLFLVLQGVKQVSQQWQHEVSISLYLNNSDNTFIQNTLKELRNNSAVAAVKYISADQGLADLEKSLGIDHLSQSLPNNPLPGVIQVFPVSGMSNPEKMQQLANSFIGMSGVQDIQLDTIWVQRVNAVITFIQRLGIALVVLLLLGIVGILINQIKITLLKSSNDLQVLHLIGASRQFIRRPLLYRSAMFSVIAVFIASFAAFIFVRWLDVPVNNFMRTYHQNIINPIGIDPYHVALIALLVIIGTALATFVASTYYLLKKDMVAA